MEEEKQQLKFPGFPEKPEENYWQYPEIMNGFWHILTPIEQKVLDYILRHTWGWHKNSDYISYSQLKTGIPNVDLGTGIKSDKAISRALKGLVKKNMIKKISGKEGGTSNHYSLILKQEGLSQRHYPSCFGQEGGRASGQDTINNVTINNKTIIVGKADDAFLFKNKLDEMTKDKQKHIQIIALYWQIKGFNFENKEQYQAALKRELRPARQLVGYSMDRIRETIEWLSEETDINFKLETVHKYIDEDLDNIEPLKIKRNHH